MSFSISYVFKIIDKFSVPMKEIRENMEKMQEEIEKLEAHAKKATTAMERFSGSLRHIGKEMMLKVTAPLVTAGGYAIKQAADFHMMELSLQAFTGTAEKAEEIMSVIKKMSMEMPVSAEKLTAASSMLLQTGVAVKDVPDQLQKVAVMAMATGTDIDTMSARLGKMRVIGSAAIRTVARASPAMVMGLRQMAKQAGMSEKAVNKLFGKVGTKISWKLIQQNFDMLTQKGGKFYDIMLAKSHTFHAGLEKMHNTLRIIAGTLGNILLDAFGIDTASEMTSKKLENMAISFQKFTDQHRVLMRIVIYTLAIGAALGPILWSLGNITKLMKGILIIGRAIEIILLHIELIALIQPEFLIISAAIAAIVIGLMYAYKYSKPFRDMINDIAFRFKLAADRIKMVYDWMNKISHFLLTPFEANVNVKANTSDLKKQMGGLNSFWTGQFGMAGASPLTMQHNVNSSIFLDLNAPSGVVKNVRASGGSVSVKQNLGQNNAFARIG